MKVREFLKRAGYSRHSYQDITFVIGKRIGEGHASQLLYGDTPRRSISDYWDCESIMDDCIVLNTKCNVPAWLSGANWNPQIDNGSTICLLIIKPEDMYEGNSDQWKSTESYIDKKIEDILLTWKRPAPYVPKNGIESITCRESEHAIEDIKEALERDGKVEVHNDYETFYGCGFDKWLRTGLAEIACTIEVKQYDNRNEFPRSYTITKA